MEGGEQAGACPWWGGGARGRRTPPPRNWKKRCCVRGNFNLLHLCFTNEIRGESICKMEGWADRRVSIVGGGGERGPCPPPRNGEKDVVRKKF